MPAYRIRSSLGPGLLESVYEMVLAESWRIGDWPWSGNNLYPASIGASVAPVHKKQLLTYLRLAEKRLGMLINFNVSLIREGITRIANGMPDDFTQRRERRKRYAEGETVSIC